MKANIKDFIVEHKEAVAVALGIGVTYAIGYKMGKNLESMKISCGLGMCCAVNPEIEPMINDAIAKIRNRKD